MIEVKFFGTARVKFQVRSIEVEANDVKELISVVAERFCIREILNFRKIQPYYVIGCLFFPKVLNSQTFEVT